MRQPSLNLSLKPTHCWTAICKEKIKGDERGGGREARKQTKRAEPVAGKVSMDYISIQHWELVARIILGKRKKKTHSGTHYISSHLLGRKECNKKKKERNKQKGEGGKEWRGRNWQTTLWQINTKSLRPSLPWSVY